MILQPQIPLLLGFLFPLFVGNANVSAANPASPATDAQSLAIPAPENIPLPKGLTGFVSMRLSKLSAVLETLPPVEQQKLTLNELLPLERICGVPARGVSTLCFGTRSSDQKGALLVSTREPLSLEKAAETLGLAADKPAPLGPWTQVTFKSAGQPAILAVQTSPNDLLLLHTPKPADETPATVAGLNKDLAAMRSAVAMGSATFWGFVPKSIDEPFAGCLPGISHLSIYGAPVHFDIRVSPANLELRSAVGGLIGSNPVLVAKSREVFDAAAREGLKHPPVWQSVQNKGTFSARVIVPAGFLEEGVAGLLSDTKIVKAKRHAQNLASCFAAAQAAGCDHFDSGTDVAKVIGLLRKGVQPAAGNFTSNIFKVKLDDNDATAAAEYLRLTENGLEYDPDLTPKNTAENKARVFHLWGRLLETALPDSPYENGRLADAKARRNAQSLVAACAAARAAGATAFDKITEVDDFIQAISTGVSGSGQFSASIFRVELEPAEAVAAAKYLVRNENGALICKPGLVEE